jgi:hypothetical protein
VSRDEDGPSRRALLNGATAALAGAGALLLGGCGGQTRSATTTASVKTAPRPVQDRDVEILSRALALERRTVAAYTAGIPLLDRRQAKVAKQFLNEELEHTGELLSLIKAAGGQSPPRAASYAIGHPTDAAGVLGVLHSLEAMQIATYLDAIPRLSPPGVRAAVSTILTSDAQHVAILRLNRGMPPVPTAFVTGAE